MAERAKGERDPRVDPRPGDVVRTPAGETFYVWAVAHGIVKYADYAPRHPETCHVADWVEYAKHDEVVFRAETQDASP